MKIYTKTGDSGETSLLGGTRVSKAELQIESYGTVDELNAYIGLIRDQITQDSIYLELIEIQDRLFTIGSHLANDQEKSKIKLPNIVEEDIERLEKQIDTMNHLIPPMRAFILPGGHTHVSHLHIARCICRRAERKIVQLNHKWEIDPSILKYMNRLSDYLFVLSRKLSKDLGVKEIEWQPRK
ncbi:MAG: ATP:cob(I)alamin adenosyltransferase [Flavobacteriales bacterium]|nr:ATP:cob(I)alamin adenosyltransferase [Flavobacteriales bacterium]